MGGIGQSIARWMVQRQYKHLIILSRSAEKSSDSRKLVTALEEAGCNVMVRSCDVADKNDLTRVLTECSLSFPPVKGLVQAAMALNVS